jgi:nitrite reductase (NADH) small subunit
MFAHEEAAAAGEVAFPTEPMLSLDLGPVTLIPLGEGRLFSVGRLVVAVFRTRREELFATEAWCPHQGGSLADGMVADGRVVCPLHAYRFSLATGRPDGHSCGVLSTFEVGRRPDGHVWLRVPAACTT